MILAVTRVRGERWDSGRGLREQDAWDEHAAFMEALVDDGFVLMGGLLGEDKVLHVVTAASEQEVIDRLAADPWEPMRLLRTVSVERWRVLLGTPPG